MKTLLQILSPLLLLPLLVATASATSIRPLDMQQIHDAAETIIHARVSGQQVRLDDVSGRVVTLTRFEIIETLKGDATGTHTIKQLGGRLPGSEYVHRIHGMPRFIDGEEYIVFLPPVSASGFSSPVGLSQGNFRIEMVEGEARVRTRQHQDAAATTVSRPAVSGPAGKPSRLQSVADFKRQIRSMTGAGR